MTSPIELAYLGIEVPDPASLSTFFGDVIGLVPGVPTPDGATTWRNDDRAHRVIIESGAVNDATAVGIEAADLDAMVARLRGAGFEATEGSPADCERRRVERLVHTAAPWGVDVEIVTGLADAPTAFESPIVPGGFLTNGMGFGHLVFATTAFDESVRFVTDGLGFRRSDRVETEIAPGFTLEIGFFHCNPRHHTIALARAPFELPQRLHHLMLEANDRDDVGHAFDRAWDSGLPIPSGLGLHDNDRMFSFYVSSPAGFQVEFGHGARTVGDDWDDDRVYTRGSVWGHKPLRRA